MITLVSEVVTELSDKIEDQNKEIIRLKRKIKNQRRANRGMHKMQMISERLCRSAYEEKRADSLVYYRKLDRLTALLKQETGFTDMQIWQKTCAMHNNLSKLSAELGKE